MKGVVFLVLLVITLSMTGTAGAVPAVNKLLLNPDLEEYDTGADSGGQTDFSGRTEGGTVSNTHDVVYGGASAPFLGVDSDSLIQCFALPSSGVLAYGAYFTIWTKSPYAPEQPGIRIRLGDPGDTFSDSPFSSNAGVRGYYSEHIALQGELAGTAASEANPSGVPEPDTMMLLGSGLLVLAGIGRRFTRT